MEFARLRQKIEASDSIVIFRHSHPDGDAVGSQLALKSFIEDNYPNKGVYAYGKEHFEVYPLSDEVSDEILKKSLGIVLDTANAQRIDNFKYQLCPYLIKIDHHPNGEDFADENYVFSDYAATAEILTEIFFSQDFKGLNIFKNCASYLYSALLTDTLRFSTSNVSANTLKMASLLAQKGIDIYELNQKMFVKDYHSYRFCTYLRSKLIFEQGLAYAIIDNNDLQKFGISADEARNHVSELGNVKEFKVWALFTQTSDDRFAASIRSTKAIVINDIAQAYGGGGHKNAAGIKDLTSNAIMTLTNDLKERLNGLK